MKIESVADLTLRKKLDSLASTLQVASIGESPGDNNASDGSFVGTNKVFVPFLKMPADINRLKEGFEGKYAHYS